MSRRGTGWGLERLALNRLWGKYKTHTMISKKRYMDNLALAQYYMRKHGLGDCAVVECGTWRGGVSFGMVDALPQVKEFHFFDSYEGLPDATDLDGAEAIRQQKEGELWFDNNSADYDRFMADIDGFGLSNRGISVHKGWFQDTLPDFRPERPIGLLRLDGDWYDSTMCILDNLFDHVAPGGLLLIDDYYDWEGCTKAVHDFLSKRKLMLPVRQSYPAGVAFMLKEKAAG